MKFRVKAAIVGFWLRRRLGHEAKLTRRMPKPPLNLAPWITFGNWA